MQGIMGQVVQGHGGRQGWAWARGGVGKAPQGVLVPPQVHVVVQPLQGLEEAGVCQLESVTRKPTTSCHPSSINPIAQTHHTRVLGLQ